MIGAWGYTGAYVLAGCIAVLSAVLTLFLRQPGRIRRQLAETELVARPSAATGG